MIVDRQGQRGVVVRYRDPETLERKTDKLNTYPYGFVETDKAEFVECKSKEDGYVGLYGEQLTKCTFHDVQQVSQLKERFDKTWECNIPFTNRALVDSGKNYPFYKHRVWYLDCEWIEAKDDELNVISVYDNYMEKMLTWFVDHTASHKGFRTKDTMRFRKHPEDMVQTVYPIPCKVFSTEREMLEDFFKTMQDKDPDVITGWWLLQADIATLFKRCKANGLDTGKMFSPFGRVQYRFDAYDQPIKGRICIDLMQVFCRLWQTKNGQLPGQSLDDVALFCLGEQKVKLPDGHDTYYTDTDLYVHYNRQDVWLMPKLDKMLNCIDHFLNLQHIVQCDFSTTPYVTRLTSVLILRDEEFDRRIPTRSQFAKEEYQGADIQEPEPGLFDDVAILDIQAMYHSNVSNENISWETLNEDGVTFDKENKGLLCRMMDLLTDLRNEYKTFKKSAQTDEERRKWDSAQYATKSLVASLYGVCGDSRYSMYHPAVASAITGSSRRCLGKLRRLCEEAGHKVIYGHTDSVFVQVEGGVEVALPLNESLNRDMAPIIVEYEKHCERILLKAKNRYAGKVIWTEGKYHDPDYYVKGIEVIQARMPKTMKEVMQATLNAMLDGRSVNSLNDELSDYITEVVKGNVNAQDLAMKGKLKKNLEDYATLSGSSAAARWAHINLGKNYRKGDYFWTLLDDSGNYIGGDTVEEIMAKADIGYKHFAERFILKKVEPLYGIAGWDMSPLNDALNGRAPVEWL